MGHIRRDAIATLTPQDKKEHDFVGYFREFKLRGGIAEPHDDLVPLRRQGAGTLTVPRQAPCESYAHAEVDPTASSFELLSSLATLSSGPDLRPLVEEPGLEA